MDMKFKCPMMCGMNMMYQPGPMDMQPDMEMDVDGGVEMDLFLEDEEDERQLMKMYPESCRLMMSFVVAELDGMQAAAGMPEEALPDKDTVDTLAANAYKTMLAEMPEMADESETRQYYGRQFSRDLLKILLLNELLRRRRRSRRDFYGYPPGPYDLYGDYYIYD
ncbi:MAG: hypothetical protein ACM3ZR_04295 [Pseudomonadota bacterium]